MALQDMHSVFDWNRKHPDPAPGICMGVAKSPIIPLKHPLVSRMVKALQVQHNRLAMVLMSSNDPFVLWYRWVKTNSYSVDIRCRLNALLFHIAHPIFLSILDMKHMTVLGWLFHVVFVQPPSFHHPMRNTGISSCSCNQKCYCKRKRNLESIFKRQKLRQQTNWNAH